MVLRTARQRPAVVIPDELALTMWGHDPAARGLASTWEPARAEALLVADPLPASLVEALARIRRELPHEVEVLQAHTGLPEVDEARPSGPEGHGHDASPDPEEHAGDHGDDGHGDHGDDGHGGNGGHHDHGDMMAIVGDPSADGLVMEPIHMAHGPLAPGLPGGLVLNVELDGDVVASCQPEPTLTYPRSAGDPLAPVAAAMTAGQERTWRMIGDLELERALSHAAWLRGFARLLAWGDVVERSQRLVSATLAARRALEGDERGAAHVFRDALGPARALRGRLHASRRLKARTGGRGVIDPAARLSGPNLRACGRPDDPRSTDAAYRELGFTPVAEAGGDALARTRVRLAEIVQSLDLASSAAERDGLAPGTWPTVEGPRGLSDDAGVTAAVAGRAAVGLEWASALVVIASFDLSPWRART